MVADRYACGILHGTPLAGRSCFYPVTCHCYSHLSPSPFTLTPSLFRTQHPALFFARACAPSTEHPALFSPLAPLIHFHLCPFPVLPLHPSPLSHLSDRRDLKMIRLFV